jgi:flagellar biosynthesis chaperone FliJ
VQKFAWPLQRLLDVKTKQENAMRAELMALTEQSAALRSRIMMERIVFRGLLDEVSRTDPDRRIAAQAEFMQHVHVRDAQIKTLSAELEKAELKRQEKMQELLKLRKFRKGLERLRVRAVEEYHGLLNRHQQHEQDENTCTVYARQAAAQMTEQ